jgi:ABC-type sugar transport system substrate-binding protein
MCPDEGSRDLSAVGRPRGPLNRLAILGIATVAAAGCGNEASGPLPRGASVPPPAAKKAPHLMLILPTTKSADLGILRDVMQDPDNGAGRDYIYREGIVRMGSPPSQQADVIREAVGKGVSALLVVAADPDTIAPALIEARGRGAKVVLIGREVPVEGQAFPLVTIPSPEGAARQVVTILREDAKGHLPHDARTLILAHADQDWRLQDCVGALKGAVAGADVPEAQVVPLKDNASDARRALAAAIGNRTTIGLVLVEDHVGAEAAVHVSNDRNQKFLIGGFVARLNPDQPEPLGKRAVLVDRNVAGLAKQAVKNALQLLGGKSVPDRIEIEPIFPRGTKAPEPSKP